VIYPNPRHLRAFLAVASSASFGAAAREVHMGQPALSQAIANLERVVGVALLDRTTRYVQLTPAGQDFLEDARRVLAEYERLMQRGSEWASARRGRLRILSILSVAQRLLPTLVRTFSQCHPGVDVEVFDVPDPSLHERLERREGDLAFISETDLGRGELTLPILQDPFCCIFPPEHPFAALPRVPSRLLAAEQLILPRRGKVLRSYVDGAVSRLKLAQRPIEVENLATLIGMVESGVGIALIPALSCPRAVTGGVLSRPLEQPRITRHVAIARLSEPAVMPASQAFVAHVLRELGSGTFSLPEGVQYLKPPARDVATFLSHRRSQAG